MPWIKVIQEHEAEGELKDAYDRMRQINVDYGEPNMPGQGPGAGPHPVMPRSWPASTPFPCSTAASS